MPRTKGSESRTPHGPDKDIRSLLAEKYKEKDELERIRSELEYSLFQLSDRIKLAQEELKRKEDDFTKIERSLASLEREISRLEEKEAEKNAKAEAIAAAEAKKAEIEKLVASLMADGASPDEILKALQK